jgi:cystathionine beta-lyase
VLTDVVQALYVTLHVLTEPGDGAVIQTPIYPPFLHCVDEVGRRMITNELLPGERRYEIDFDGLGAAIDERTRVLMLCNPHNPTGRVFARDELEGLAEIALERDLIIASDEIHADLVLPGHSHIPIATLGPEVEARTITLMSATKAFNIAGLRCAVAAFGSQDLLQRFNALPRHIRGGLNTLGLAATEIAWTRCQPWLDELIDYLEGTRRLVRDLLSEQLSSVRHFSPEGTYLAWLDCRALDLPGGPFRFFLKRARVALSDGTRFGQGGNGFVRLNFATSREIVTEAVERMAKAVQSHGA